MTKRAFLDASDVASADKMNDVIKPNNDVVRVEVTEDEPVGVEALKSERELVDNPERALGLHTRCAASDFLAKRTTRLKFEDKDRFKVVVAGDIKV